MSDAAEEKLKAIMFSKIESKKITDEIIAQADEVVRQASKFRQSHVGLARAIKRYQQLREKKA